MLAEWSSTSHSTQVILETIFRANLLTDAKHPKLNIITTNNTKT